MCIIWSVLEFIIQAVYKFKKGVPPGGQVAATLIIWLAAAIVGPLEGVFAGLDDGESCDYTYNGRYYEETNCYDPWSGKRKMWVAITALTCLLAVIYFALFVRACIDTARYNRARNRPIMVVNPAAYWGPPNNGWQAVPQGNYIPMEQPSAQPQPQPQTPGQYFMPTPQPAAVPASQVDEKGKGVEQPANTVREFYTPGQAS